ncbi:carbohydrate ABC transporter permease [Paenibacillus sp. GCM10027626]|uniref:carbohydrate ABC transporter permease n=1 Tax=Paenibacillus sp. GCM10027626 TaxID=3273411 RepID=UPI00363A5861
MRLSANFSQKEERAAFLFILPAVACLALFTFYPMINAFIISFKDYSLINPDSAFIGLTNYKNLLSDPKFTNSLLHSFHLAIVIIPVQTIAALMLALLVYKSSVVANLFRTAYFMPVVISLGVASTLFKLIYNQDYGLLNSLLHVFGVPPISFLSDSNLALYGIMLLGIWKSAGFFMVIFVAGLNGIPNDLYEAAEVDGATKTQKFFSITLPLLRRTLTFVIIITTMDALKLFVPVALVTGGGPADSTTTSVFYIYKMAFQQMEMGYGSAAAFILFVIVMCISIVQLRLLKSDVEY